MLKMQFLATVLLAASCPTSAWSQEAWQVDATCSVAAPAEEGKPKLTIIATMKAGATASSIQIRVQTDEVVLKDDEKSDNVSVSIPSEEDFTGLTATGSVRRKTNLVTILVPADTNILPSFSRGASAVIKVPTADGEKVLEFDLAGSGAAIKQLSSRCG